jgi:hypothetical protein
MLTAYCQKQAERHETNLFGEYHKHNHHLTSQPPPHLRMCENKKLYVMTEDILWGIGGGQMEASLFLVYLTIFIIYAFMHKEK